MSDFAPMPEESLDRWLADQHRALVDDLAAALDLEAGLREAMIPARHAGLVADLRDVLDVEAGLSAIVPATPDTAFEADPEPWRIEGSTWPPGSVAVAVRRGTAARVFVSYASEDRALAGELYRRLVEDGHEVLLDQDLRDSIAVGEEWKQQLHERLRWADAMVCVVTSAYLASRSCTAEVDFAWSRGSWLLPVWAEPGLDDPLLRSVEDTDLARDSVRAALVRTLRRVDDTGVLRWPEDRSPFPGLEPFTAALSRVFFGRAAEAREVGNRLRAMGSAGGMLAIVGPSGCGKSSLLNAAVVPLLDRDPAWLTVPRLVPGSDPLPELAQALATTATRLGLDWSASDVRGRLEAGTDGLRRVADDLLAVGSATHQRRLLVSIDQAEELFTRTSPDVLQGFARLLCDAIAGPVRVVATMRSEFLDDLSGLPVLAGVPIEAYVLAPPDREMLRDVIEQPAKVARLRLDDGLAAQLVADTDSGEALPLLAFTLRQLADGLPVGGTLSLARYHDLGGVRGALTRHADAALTEAVQASGLTEREVLAGLTRLVTVDDTGRRGRRRIRVTDLAEPLCVALRIFIDRRLLLSDTDDNGHVWLTVAHEALLTGWRPLDTATTDITVALRTARTVEQAAADWNSAGRPEHYLWDNERLTATLTTLRMNSDSGDRNDAAPPIVELDDEASAFLDATSQRVHATKQRERRRRTRTITVLSTLLVLALIAAGIAVWQQQQASSARLIATARQLVAQAEVARSTDPRTALQLGLAAQRIYPDAETYSSLVNLVTNTRYSGTLTGHTGPVNFVAFSPDGHTLATASSDTTVILWDVTDPIQPRRLGQPLTGHTDAVNSVAFSPDAHTLATASSDTTVILWDVTDPIQPRRLGQPLTGHTDAVYDLAFAPDGRTLATASSDNTVRLWDTTDPRNPALTATLTGHTNSVYDLAFAPDGRTLATASSDNTVRLWDTTDPRNPALTATLTGHTSPVNSVAFSPDAHTLATASSDRTVRLWNLTDPRNPVLITTLTGHTSPVNSVAFSPDAHTLATASSDRTVRLWNLTSPRNPVLITTLTGQNGVVRWVAFAADGHTLATGGDDATTILWDLTLNASRATERACSITGGGLNPDEWARYIPGLPYENTCPS